MKRTVMAILLAAATMGTGLSTQQPALAASPGNAGAAHTCNQGGYGNLIGTNGTTDTRFTNAGKCASYAAQGGMVVSITSARPCLSGGYATLMPSGGTSPFPSEAACVLYVGQGGTPVAATVLTYTEVCSGGQASQTFSGSGLQPGSFIYITWLTGPGAVSTILLARADFAGNFSYTAVGLILFPGSFYMTGTAPNGQQVTSNTFTQTACP